MLSLGAVAAVAWSVAALSCPEAPARRSPSESRASGMDVGLAGGMDVGLAGGILPALNHPGFLPSKACGEVSLAQSAFVWPGKVPDPNFPYEL